MHHTVLVITNLCTTIFQNNLQISTLNLIYYNDYKNLRLYEKIKTIKFINGKTIIFNLDSVQLYQHNRINQ